MLKYISVSGLLTRRNSLLAAGAQGNNSICFSILSSPSPYHPLTNHFLFDYSLILCYDALPLPTMHPSVSPGLGLSRGFNNGNLIPQNSLSLCYDDHPFHPSVSPGLGLSRGVSVVQQPPSKGRISNPGNQTWSTIIWWKIKAIGLDPQWSKSQIQAIRLYPLFEHKCSNHNHLIKNQSIFLTTTHWHWQTLMPLW